MKGAWSKCICQSGPKEKSSRVHFLTVHLYFVQRFSTSDPSSYLGLARKLLFFLCVLSVLCH